MKSVFALGAVAAALLASTAAHAVPTLSFIVNGGPAVTCADGAACDVNAAVGAVTFVSALGNFNINVTTGLTGPSVAFPTLIDLNSVNVQSNGGGANTLEILFSETGFAGPAAVSGAFGGTISGSAGSTISAYGYYGAGLFDTSNSLGVIGPFAAGAAFAGATATTNIAAPSYSLTQRLVFATTGNANWSGDFELKVPEPGTLALVGAALLGLGALRRRVK